jgi:hypothetical protein
MNKISNIIILIVRSPLSTWAFTGTMELTQAFGQACNAVPAR